MCFGFTGPRLAWCELVVPTGNDGGMLTFGLAVGAAPILGEARLLLLPPCFPRSCPTPAEWRADRVSADRQAPPCRHGGSMAGAPSTQPALGIGPTARSLDRGLHGGR